jgi:hypothetical protein
MVDIMETLHVTKKSNKMNTLEKLHIYNATRLGNQMIKVQSNKVLYATHWFRIVRIEGIPRSNSLLILHSRKQVPQLLTHNTELDLHSIIENL